MASLRSMVDLARTAEELKKDKDIPAPVAAKISSPTYPWGTTLCLNDETLAKLGIEGDLPDVGDTIHIAAMCRVTCASETENTTPDGGKETCRRIELQITHMACENEDEEPAERKKRWYGGEEMAEAAE